jgi:hypothetical protein
MDTAVRCGYHSNNYGTTCYTGNGWEEEMGRIIYQERHQDTLRRFLKRTEEIPVKG